MKYFNFKTIFLGLVDSIVLGNSQFEENTSQELGSPCNSHRQTDELEERNEAGQPHDALFLVLAYLQLLELLTMKEVCRSLRDAVDKDVLLWVDIVVEPPLNLRFSDNILVKITSKGHGRLTTLALMNCESITDDGLQRVIENNPHINKLVIQDPFLEKHLVKQAHKFDILGVFDGSSSKLYVPDCTGLTADGIVKIVKMLTEHNQDLKSLKLHGLYGLTSEHVKSLYSCLKVQQEQQKQPSMFLDYRRFSPLRHDDSTHPIDIETCPTCNYVRPVFDCAREKCKRKKEQSMNECRGCSLCIPRCEECGGCVDLKELGETVCMDFLCSDCWLWLPKCNLCKRPYCNRHADHQQRHLDDTGFLCSVCHISSIRTLAGSSELEEDIIED